MNVVEVVRGDVVEARHTVHIAVADADGRVVARAGNIDGLTYYRSSAKPLQALPLVEEGDKQIRNLSSGTCSLLCVT